MKNGERESVCVCRANKYSTFRDCRQDYVDSSKISL